MRKLRICFSTTDKPLSKAIRFFQATPYSHVFLEYYDDRYNEMMIYEARGFETHLINANNLHYTHSRVVFTYEIEMTEVVFHRVIKFIHEDVGIPYSWKEIMGYLLRSLAGYLWLKIRNPFPTKNKVCSEAIAIICMKFLGMVNDGTETADMDPKWLFGKLKSLPNTTLKEA